MSIYPEMPCAATREIDGVVYQVRKFGLNRVVIEEELYPVPAVKVVKTMNADGTEDESKRKRFDLSTGEEVR